MYIDIVTCPFCGKEYSRYEETETTNIPRTGYYDYLIKNKGTSNRYYFNINGCGSQNHFFNDNMIYNKCLGGTYELTISSCPYCKKEKITIKSYNINKSNKSNETYLFDEDLIEDVRPKFTCKSFPEYVPLAIRQDYEEANAIVKLSPKASATLARRALQGMIRDVHKIVRNRLADEINALKTEKKVSDDLWEAIDAVRKIGNIGAHMEKDVNFIIDVDEGEAEKLIELVEYLIKIWYIQKHENDELLANVTNIGKEKNSLKNSYKENNSKNCTITNNAQINGNNNTNAGNISIK